MIAVTDMARSKEFYREVLGLNIVSDFGANVTLDGGIILQTAQTWKEFINSDILFGSNACELYFEEGDIVAFASRLHEYGNIDYIHGLIEHSWGQRVIRFYDPDHHIIEVGENIASVVHRFIRSGLTQYETAIRMDIPLDYVRACLQTDNQPS
jgi:catechol 2,3-dioxygenase-like lactoylglutathione lyase family enzyme